jgi:tetratricopeptide (TPR) repeat protein
MPVDNSEAYETVSWILENADTGFFIITAPHNMQRELASLYKTTKVAIFDYAQNPAPYSFSEISAWAESCREADFYFILNMQLALKNESEMLSFNMSRDMLAKMHKAWFFFMTKETDNRLAAFAFDVYSYVRLKAHFTQEIAEGPLNDQIISYFDKPVNLYEAKEALARYKDLEKQLLALPLDDTADNQLLAAAITLSNIADLYFNCAQYEDAHKLLGTVRKIREKILGSVHPDTAAAYNDMALVCDSQGDYDKALELFGNALAIYEKVLAKEHPDTAATYNNIAGVYLHQGDYVKALEWYGKALAIREKVLGKEHPDTATTYNNIAFVYHNQGEYTKALDWFEKALAIYEKVLGKEHSSTGTTYNNMALIYLRQGDYAKALEWFEKALAIYEEVQGREHPNTADIYSNIALVYSSQGDYGKALEWYEKAIAIREKVLGKEHPYTVTTYNNIAAVNSRQGDYRYRR